MTLLLPLRLRCFNLLFPFQIEVAEGYLWLNWLFLNVFLVDVLILLLLFNVSDVVELRFAELSLKQFCETKRLGGLR